MTRRERTIKAINHQETDFVPYNVDLTYQAYERLLAYTGDPDYPSKIGSHVNIAGCTGPFEDMGNGYIKDYFGVVWNRNGADKDIGVVDEYLIKDPTLDGFHVPDTDIAQLRTNLQGFLDYSGDIFTTAGIGFSMFERAWTLRGMENLLMDMVAEPDFVHELLDTICDFNLSLMDVGLDFPFDGFYFGDDWGQQKGMIMGPGYWRTFIKPRMAKMFRKSKDAGKYIVLHSCGDIHEVFPDLIEIGLDVYQTFQPEIYDIHSVKREYGKDLTFWGGISTQRVLPFVTPDEVKETAKYMISVMGKGGGYIASPTHGVPGDVPPENIVALVEAFQNQ
ncbi:MAG: uroporphyrinogen decarboxylase family protein [Armatimonadota bacterium]